MTPGREPNHNVHSCMTVLRSELRTSAPSCPWRTIEDPLVQDVVSVRSMRRAKLPAPNLSQRLIDACAAYQGAVDSAGEARRKYEDAARKAAGQ